MRDLGFNERGERQINFDEEEEEEINGAQDLTPLNLSSSGDIELTEISISATQSQQFSKENLKSRTTKDSSLDFLDQEIEI